ncbi:MAG: choice-of-anchor G family protein [Microbacterium sp.]
MSGQEQKRARGSRGIGRRVIAPLAIGVLAAAGSIGASPASAAEPADAEALGQVLDSSLLTGELGDATEAHAVSPGGPAEDRTPLDLGAIDIGEVDTGDGSTAPLVSAPGDGGLIELGELGAQSAYASTPSAHEATASAGIIDEDGGIDVSPTHPGGYESTSVDLVPALDQAGLDVVAEGIADDIALEIGAAASTATADGADVTSDISLTDARLRLRTPLLDGIADRLDAALEGVAPQVDEALAPDGSVGSLLADRDFDVEVNEIWAVPITGTIEADPADAVLDGVRDEILSEPLTSPGGVVSIDLAAGTVDVDLGKAIPAGSVDSAGANTEVIDPESALPEVSDALVSALDSLGDRASEVVADALAEIPLTLTFDTSISYIGNTARADVTIETTFGQLAERGELGDSQARIVETGGDLDYILSFHDLSPQSFASLLRDPLLSAVRDVTASPVQSAMAHAGEEFDPVVSDLVDEVSGGLAPLVDALPDAASLTVNAQSDDDGSFTVSAASLALVGGSLAEIDFASSTVRATAGEE